MFLYEAVSDKNNPQFEVRIKPPHRNNSSGCAGIDSGFTAIPNNIIAVSVVDCVLGIWLHKCFYHFLDGFHCGCLMSKVGISIFSPFPITKIVQMLYVNTRDIFDFSQSYLCAICQNYILWIGFHNFIMH